MKSSLRASGWLVVGLLISFSCVGCGEDGPKLYPVTGTIKANGKSLEGVTVSFLPVDSAQPGSGGVVQKDGSFTLTSADGRPGAVAGKHKVVLAAPPPAVAQAENTYKTKQKQGPQEVELPFPKEYTTAAKTPKEVDVVAGSNTVEISID